MKRGAASVPPEDRGGESLLHALGMPADTGFGDDSTLDRDTSGRGRRSRWARAADVLPDSRFLSRQARRLVLSDDRALSRILRIYAVARIALGAALLAVVLIAQTAVGQAVSAPAAVCLAYLVLTIVLWARPGWHEGGDLAFGPWRWLATIGLDLAAFSALAWLERSATLNHVALLVLPVLMAGVLTPRLQALATAAAVAIMLLARAAWLTPLGADLAPALSQAGLVGIGMFVVVMLAGEVSGRLAREELTARGSLELARQQALLSRVVMEQMSEGVLVVDMRGKVRAANPVALRLLVPQGSANPPPFMLHGDPAWLELAEAVEGAFDRRDWPDAGRELPVRFDGGGVRRLLVRARFTRRGSATAAPGSASPTDAVNEDLCVLFLQDQRDVQERLRRDRLAAMGRVSAGVAHEIRNPLAAISQASALMREDTLSDGQRRLADIVSDNAARLKRIVDDVLEVAPGATSAPRPMDATAAVAQCCAEWAGVAGVPLGRGSRLRVALPHEPLGVQFDPDHLRRVLINLLDNAARHGTDQPAAVAVALVSDGDTRVRLSVASDGEPIGRDVENHLFEPFHSTRSRGSGLGLYICRQLCERYGGSITYERRPEGERHRNVFHVQMNRGALPGGAPVHL